jgi:hypothetical protein
LFAAAAAYHTGWTAFRGHAAWWLVLAGPPLLWISLRAWLDARESRLAAAALGTALLSYGVGIASYVGIGAALEPHSQVMVTAGATLFAHWMLFVGVTAYGRYVVLDAQGLVPVRRREPRVSKQAKLSLVPEVKIVAAKPTAAASASPLRSFRQSLRDSDSGRPAPVVSKPTEWVDGSEPVDDGYGDDRDGGQGNRKLSKAERKRLRKLRARDQAA